MCTLNTYDTILSIILKKKEIKEVHEKETFDIRSAGFHLQLVHVASSCAAVCLHWDSQRGYIRAAVGLNCFAVCHKQ